MGRTWLTGKAFRVALLAIVGLYVLAAFSVGGIGPFFAPYQYYSAGIKKVTATYALASPTIKEECPSYERDSRAVLASWRKYHLLFHKHTHPHNTHHKERERERS